MKTSLLRFFRLLALTALVTGASLTSSCDLLRQAQGTYNMVNCKYDFRSLSAISVAGINLSNGISLLDAPKLLTLLSGGVTSIPIGCTVNLDVQNPNSTDAILNGMDYVLAIDGVDFTSGSVAHQLSVTPGGTGLLPLTLNFDLATLLKGESRDAALGVVRNLLSASGVGSKIGLSAASTPSKVTLNIKPSFNVGASQIKSPVFIPVSFSCGG
jgi:hypothetical protein